MNVMTDAGMHADPGDPGVQQRRTFQRLRRAPGGVAAQPREIRQEIRAALGDQLVDNGPVDLVELNQ